MVEDVDALVAKLVATLPRGEQADAVSAEGEQRLAVGDAETALAFFDRALRIDARSARAWTGRSAALTKRGRTGEALGCLDRALSSQPGYPRALVQKAELLLKAGLRAEALACYDEAVASEPDVPQVWIQRAQMLEDARRLPEAVASYDRALALADVPAVWARRGELLVAIGAMDGARTSFERAVTGDESLADAWLALAKVRATLRDEDGARTAVDRFLAIVPARDARVSSARAMLEQLVRHGSKPPVRAPSDAPGSSPASSEVGALDEAEALLLVGQAAPALRKLERIVTDRPDDAEAWLLRARALDLAGNRAGALASAERALRVAPNHVDAQRVLARWFGEEGGERALAAADRLATLAPRDAEAHRLRARALALAMRHVEAVYAYEKSLHHDSSHAETWLALARVLRQLRRIVAARAAVLRAREHAGDRAALLREIEDLERRLGDAGQDQKKK